MIPAAEFKRRFRCAVKRSGKTSKEISDETGINLFNINEYRKGSSLPKAENLVLLCDCLDVSADYLLGLTDDPTTIGRSGKCRYIFDRIR